MRRNFENKYELEMPDEEVESRGEFTSPLPAYSTGDWDSLVDVPFSPEQAQEAREARRAELEAQNMDALAPEGETQTAAQSMEGLVPHDRIQSPETEQNQAEENSMQHGY